ncbi:sigma-54 interaction domain-containing protein [Caproicibacter sp. BJN0012]|uniref:sigma-54 interaction domain-containing protein n=1 Tax=Caproicibacter sp. BJN0012 TaxID=3110227 RepID=UPI002E137826|nr:sigma 54-interacting transcriptional regulator [Caproicibacter sp. BJN0012]
MEKKQERWENLHHDFNLVNRLPEPLLFFWKRCLEKGIDPETDTFKIYSDEDFKKIKDESIKIYAYSNRFLLQITQYLVSSEIGFALFDSKGCLLKLYGGSHFLDWCSNQKIRVKSSWNEDSIGANAVSIGIETRKAVSVAGSENYCRALCGTAVYFAPFILDDDKTHEAILMGGIALIAPREKSNPDYLMMPVAAANDVALHLYMGNSFYELHYTESKGLISIDIDTLNGKPHILYHNSQIFSVLDTAYSNLYFRDVDTLFDPPPKNKEFWEIIAQNKKISSEDMVLSIRGRESNYTVSTETYWQEHLRFRGIRFFISTSKKISSGISKPVGDNAFISFDNIFGNDGKFKNSIRMAKMIAKSDSNVLILGESGVGKDMFAQAIHNASERRNKPFIVVNCAAFPHDLITSELFGYEEGAFTGAKKSGNIGKFELANNGTIFLDEIGDMPLELQATLLRVIEQKSFMRIGSNVVTNVDVRIIAATNANLQQLIDQKKFRADLYYRLSTLRLNIPPLRERGNDIILLAEHFIHAVSRRTQKPNIMTLSDEAKALLCRLPLKGNVRELQNLIEGIVQLYPIDVIEPMHIKEYLGLSDDFSFDSSPTASNKTQAEAEEARIVSADDPPETPAASKEKISEALRQNLYNKTNTAKYLGISRKTLYRWLKNYGLLSK